MAEWQCAIFVSVGIVAGFLGGLAMASSIYARHYRELRKEIENG